MRSTDELGIHFKIARNNGLTDDEIAEVVYHASGYAGFPAANTACKIARSNTNDGASSQRNHGLVYGPTGPDIPREFAAFAAAVGTR